MVVWSGVESGVWSGVGSGVLAPYQSWLHEPITRGLEKAKSACFSQYRGGNLWCSWEAWASWFRDVGGLHLQGDLWDRLQCSIDLCLAGFSWWYKGVCIISDRPTEIHVENVGGVNRLHGETGPAIAWADGFAIYAWHGTLVPADLIESEWDTRRIFEEPNAEIRRCAIEKLGWDKFIGDSGMALVAEAE